ncbi:MAG TPA: NUDIX domain-containing protein [Candidatus Saccharimonas sp.]|nr:NUDIX domain-containing protein [Candidatus Saccharimonas sp.]
MEVNFCRRCGTKVTQKMPGVYKCKQGHDLFYDASPAGLCLLLNSRDEVLMVVRSRDPGKGTLDLPGGFLGFAETYEDGTVRELREELGLEPTMYTKLTYLCDAIDMYNYQGETKTGLPVVFMARVKNDDVQLTPHDDVGSAKWMPISDIKSQHIGLGFNGVRKALYVMRRRLEQGS